MLLRRPKEFERVAREWAVIHAGAPRKHAGEGSGGATDETLRQEELRAKAEQERQDLSKYVTAQMPCFIASRASYLTHVTGTTDITKT
jgi:ubiquitin-conjugating enzyme (huntingtin interacting protein 2)